jgi:hypothetical protein
VQCTLRHAFRERGWCQYDTSGNNHLITPLTAGPFRSWRSGVEKPSLSRADGRGPRGPARPKAAAKRQGENHAEEEETRVRRSRHVYKTTRRPRVHHQLHPRSRSSADVRASVGYHSFVRRPWAPRRTRGCRRRAPQRTGAEEGRGRR